MPSPDDPQQGRATRGWTLSPQAFDRLLLSLDPDRDRAAVVYEELRERTIGLLRWWGASSAEDLADRTLDRVARKIDEGTAITEGSFGAFVRGVARMVFYESSREPRAAVDVAPPAPIAESDALRCFDRCLDSLPEDDRRVLLGYYDEGKAKDVRRTLAGELGLSGATLRIRVHRLRERLERCTTACLGER